MILTDVVLLSVDEAEPSTCLRVDGMGQVLSRRALTPETPLAEPAERAVLVVPGADVLAAWLEVPQGSPAQAAAAAAMMMEEQLSAPGEGVLLALGPVAESGDRLAAAVNPVLLDGWLARAEALNVRPDVVTPDHLALSPPAEQDGLHVVARGGLWVVRGHQLAFSAEPELAALLIGERAEPVIEDDERALTLLAEGAIAAPVNLLRLAPGREEAAVVRRRLRRAAALAALALLSPLLISGTEAARKTVAASRLEDQAQARAQAALGANAPVADPLAALEARARASGAEGGLALAAGPLLSAVQGLGGANVRSLVYTPDGVLRASVAHANYSDVDVLRSTVGQAGLDLQPGGAVSEGDRIVTDLMVRPRP